MRVMAHDEPVPGDLVVFSHNSWTEVYSAYHAVTHAQQCVSIRDFYDCSVVNSCKRIGCVMSEPVVVVEVDHNVWNRLTSVKVLSPTHGILFVSIGTMSVKKVADNA